MTGYNILNQISPQILLALAALSHQVRIPKRISSYVSLQCNPAKNFAEFIVLDIVGLGFALAASPIWNSGQSPSASFLLPSFSLQLRSSISFQCWLFSSTKDSACSATNVCPINLTKDSSRDSPNTIGTIKDMGQLIYSSLAGES
jgi:hypothetical protein